MVLRFPGLGMPIPDLSDEGRPPTYAEHINPMSPSMEAAATIAKPNVVGAVSRPTTGVVGDKQGQEEEGNTVASDWENTAFGDLFVEVAVTLPAGEGMSFPWQGRTGYLLWSRGKQG